MMKSDNGLQNITSHGNKFSNWMQSSGVLSQSSRKNRKKLKKKIKIREVMFSSMVAKMMIPKTLKVEVKRKSVLNLMGLLFLLRSF